MCVNVVGCGCMYHGSHIEVRRQLLGADSFLLLWFLEIKLGSSGKCFHHRVFNYSLKAFFSDLDVLFSFLIAQIKHFSTLLSKNVKCKQPRFSSQQKRPGFHHFVFHYICTSHIHNLLHRSYFILFLVTVYFLSWRL